LADDYGIGEVGCYGADHYRTPHLDALARSGTRYTHAYTISLCGPSRAQILTGRYGFRTGGSNQDAVGEISPQRETLIPTVLKPAGYVSTMIGKWSQFSRQPSDFGFDEYLRYAGSGAYWNTQEKVKTYVVNGETRPLRDREYLPDLMHRHLVDFMTRHRDRPFYVHYSLSHVHGDILPTPDSAPDSQDHYADNVHYMDKLVGQLLAELDRLGLRERTLVVFFGDNGTANPRAERATIGGRRLAGAKGSVLDGGGRVPLIVSWPGQVPAGRVSADLVDSSDFLPTFAALAGAALPANLVLDGRNQAAQFRGEAPGPRSWVFHQLARNWYVREAGWKLNQAGELFDMSDAPFVETLVPAGAETPAARAARQRLAAALAELNPAGGIPDTGDESGRHAKNVEAKKKKGRDK
ncbi:MAG: sulfatase-like hydrolase/transferase, partial [Opitutaceae bacterium]